MKQKNQIYLKHQAFEKTHKEIQDDSSKTRVDGFDAPKQYHHDPSKLEIFKDFSHYIKWANELYSSGIKIIGKLELIYDESTKATSSYYKLNSERKIEDILKKLGSFQADTGNLREDIREFQICMLATHISEKGVEIEALSDQVRQLSFMEDRIIDTCNRKLFEISSSRMSFYSLLVSTMALGVSFIAILTTRT